MKEKENGLVVYKESTISKIFNFIKGLFSKKNKMIDIEDVPEVSTKKDEKKLFEESVKASSNSPGEKLFNNYRNGEITESEMTLDQIILLKKVYNKKIQHAKVELAYMNKKLDKKVKAKNKSL